MRLASGEYECPLPVNGNCTIENGVCTSAGCWCDVDAGWGESAVLFRASGILTCARDIRVQSVIVKACLIFSTLSLLFRLLVLVRRVLILRKPVPLKKPLPELTISVLFLFSLLYASKYPEKEVFETRNPTSLCCAVGFWVIRLIITLNHRHSVLFALPSARRGFEKSERPDKTKRIEFLIWVVILVSSVITFIPVLALLVNQNAKLLVWFGITVLMEEASTGTLFLFAMYRTTKALDIGMSLLNENAKGFSTLARTRASLHVVRNWRVSGMALNTAFSLLCLASPFTQLLIGSYLWTVVWIHTEVAMLQLTIRRLKASRRRQTLHTSVVRPSSPSRID